MLLHKKLLGSISDNNSNSFEVYNLCCKFISMPCHMSTVYNFRTNLIFHLYVYFHFVANLPIITSLYFRLPFLIYYR